MQGHDGANEFHLVAHRIERHGLVHQQAVVPLLPFEGERERLRLGRVGTRGGQPRQQGGHHGAGFGQAVGGLAHHLGFGQAQERAGRRVGHEHHAAFVEQEQGFVERLHDAGHAVALGEHLGQVSAAEFVEVHQQAVEGLRYLPKLVAAFDGNGGREIPLHGVFDAGRELAQAAHGGFGHAEGQAQGHQEADGNEGEQSTAGAHGGAVGLLVFAGQGLHVKLHHAVGEAPQPGQRDRAGGGIARQPRVPGQAGSEAIHQGLLAGLGHVAGLAPELLAEARQALGCGGVDFGGVQRLQHALAELHRVEIVLQDGARAVVQPLHGVVRVGAHGQQKRQNGKEAESNLGFDVHGREVKGRLPTASQVERLG